MLQPIKLALAFDNSLFRSGMKSLLHTFAGYDVIFEAFNGKDVIDFLQAGQLPDLLLLSVYMRGMDGLETTCWVQANYPSVKVLVFTAKEDPAVVNNLMAAGARGHIPIWCEPAELKSALKDIVKKGFYKNSLRSSRF